MSANAMSGNDSLTINNRIIADLADGDAIIARFPDAIANLQVGKNGNTIYGNNETGKRLELEIRVVRGTSDDKFFNNLLVQQQANFAGFVLMTGEFVKKIGDGAGVVTNDTYVLSGGVFVNAVEGKSNVSGDTAQSVSVYKMQFSFGPRAIG